MRRSETQRGAQDDIIRTVRAQLGATRESSAVGTSVFIGSCLALCHAPLASALALRRARLADDAVDYIAKEVRDFAWLWLKKLTKLAF